MFDRIVFVTAAPAETRAVLRGVGDARGEVTRRRLHVVDAGTSVLETGIGKANAASAVARAGAGGAFAGACVINLGVAGTLAADLAIGASIVATASVFADEGVRTPSGFLDCAALGFPILPGVEGDAVGPAGAVLAVVGGLTDAAGVVATVSTCSGTDALAGEVVRRSGARAEGMEGAAVGLACLEAGAAFAEVRVISNTTGDRDRQVWRLDAALARVEALASEIAAALR